MLHTQVPSAACSIELSTIKLRAKRPRGHEAHLAISATLPLANVTDIASTKKSHSCLWRMEGLYWVCTSRWHKKVGRVWTQQGIGISGEGAGWRVGGEETKSEGGGWTTSYCLTAMLTVDKTVALTRNQKMQIKVKLWQEVPEGNSQTDTNMKFMICLCKWLWKTL